MGYRDWNEEAMTVMTRDLEAPWNALYRSIGTVGDEVMSTASHAMEWAVNHLGNISIHLKITHPFTRWSCGANQHCVMSTEESLEADSDSMRPLLEALTTRQLLLSADVEGKHEKLEDGAL